MGCELYKRFSASLAPALQNRFNEAFSKGFLPCTPSLTSVTLNAKKDKDSLLCSSYRPITLWNEVYKILTEILSLRLQVLPQIISTDQTGFITGRYSFYNTRKLLSILSVLSSDVPEVILALDVEKANGDSSFVLMQSFGFDGGLMDQITVCIYTGICGNYRVVSPPCLLQRGTKQGSPFHAIEPLLLGFVRM